MIFLVSVPWFPHQYLWNIFTNSPLWARQILIQQSSSHLSIMGVRKTSHPQWTDVSENSQRTKSRCLFQIVPKNVVTFYLPLNLSPSCSAEVPHSSFHSFWKTPVSVNCKNNSFHETFDILKSCLLRISALGNFLILGYYSYCINNIPSALYPLKVFKCLSAATYISNNIHED